MAAPAGSVDIGPTAAVSEPIAAPDPAFALIGVAGDGVDGVDGGGRTAIIAGPGQLFLVKEGDLVAEHYRVRRVSADAVDLVLDEMTSAGHAALHLTLK